MGKKLQRGCFMILAAAWLVLNCTGCALEAGNGVSEIFKAELNEQMINIQKDTTIIIHTFGGEQHIARGRLDIIKSGSDHEETILELQGSIETRENTAAVPAEITKERGKPTVLTVYMNEHIYGFYSSYEIHVDSNDSGNYIELYGYLEGYSDGKNIYST